MTVGRLEKEAASTRKANWLHQHVTTPSGYVKNSNNHGDGSATDPIHEVRQLTQKQKKMNSRLFMHLCPDKGFVGL